MKKCKTIIAVVMAISMALSVFALVGCQPASEKTQRDPEVQAVYEAYVAQAEEAGEDVLSYDEWLADLKASVKGDKGDKGDNGTNGTNGKDGSSWRVGTTEPEATLGNEGDFYLNTETFDLYLKGAEGWSKLTNIKGTDGQNGTNGTNGTDGKSAYELWKDANPESEMDEAQWLESLKGANGTNGTNGENGARGNKITKGEGAPTSTEGAIEGDMYIDTTEWNVYFFEDSAWKDYGSIKGSGAESEEPAPTTIEVDIAADGEQQIDVTLSEGFHIIKADLGATTLSTGRLYAKVGEIDSELVLSKTRSDAAGGNKIYFGYIDVKADTTKITISAKIEAVKATISFEDYVQPTLKADGQPIEVPVNLNAVGTAGTGALKLKLDSSIVATNSYLVKIIHTAETTHLAASIQSIGLQVGARMITFIKPQYEGAGVSVTLTEENITAANGECWFYCPSTSGVTPAIFPITVTMTVKEA